MTYTDTQVIGSLLRGDSLLFGARVELSWPQGLPAGFTESDLRDIGQHWGALVPDHPVWIPADSEFCAARIRCGEPLTKGECRRHGKGPAGPAEGSPASKPPCPGRDEHDWAGGSFRSTHLGAYWADECAACGLKCRIDSAERDPGDGAALITYEPATAP